MNVKYLFSTYINNIIMYYDFYNNLKISQELCISQII